MSFTDYSKAGNPAPFNVLELGAQYATEYARETQQIQANDPLSFALPQRGVPQREIRVEWVEEELRLLGVVRSGQQNKLNTFGRAKEFRFQPAMFRRGDILDMETINYLRAPGETTESKEQQEYGMNFYRGRLDSLIQQGNLMWAYLRAQLMSGGINYLDQETGNTIIADPGIPNANFYTIGAGAFAGSAHWTDTANAKIVDDFQSLVYMMKIRGKNPPKFACMSSAMRQMISRNNQVRQFLPGNTSGLFAMGLVTWGKDGMVESICGIQFIEHYKLVDDYKADASMNIERKYMWPLNKVSFFSVDNPELPGQKLGWTITSKGENPAGTVGFWVRTAGSEELVDATLPPGLQIQAGMSGLPALWKPWWVHIVTPCTVTELTTVLGNDYVPA